MLALTATCMLNVWRMQCMGLSQRSIFLHWSVIGLAMIDNCVGLRACALRRAGWLAQLPAARPVGCQQLCMASAGKVFQVCGTIRASILVGVTVQLQRTHHHHHHITHSSHSTHTVQRTQRHWQAEEQ
ncbi:hypothetical protein COO60DRAFT_12084 [Scenedesmus sp. NREL 46B-D3]|nr:hypothetical protein COO60DRAFT_12084 [Scenedesmus sp. NREL 46B-D3]